MLKYILSTLLVASAITSTVASPYQWVESEVPEFGRTRRTAKRQLRVRRQQQRALEMSMSLSMSIPEFEELDLFEIEIEEDLSLPMSMSL